MLGANAVEIIDVQDSDLKRQAIPLQVELLAQTFWHGAVIEDVEIEFSSCTIHFANRQYLVLDFELLASQGVTQLHIARNISKMAIVEEKGWLVLKIYNELGGCASFREEGKFGVPRVITGLSDGNILRDKSLSRQRIQTKIEITKAELEQLKKKVKKDKYKELLENLSSWQGLYTIPLGVLINATFEGES